MTWRREAALRWATVVSEQTTGDIPPQEKPSHPLRGFSRGGRRRRRQRWGSPDEPLLGDSHDWQIKGTSESERPVKDERGRSGNADLDLCGPMCSGAKGVGWEFKSRDGVCVCVCGGGLWMMKGVETVSEWQPTCAAVARRWTRPLFGLIMSVLAGDEIWLCLWTRRRRRAKGERGGAWYINIFPDYAWNPRCVIPPPLAPRSPPNCQQFIISAELLRLHPSLCD